MSTQIEFTVINNGPRPSPSTRVVFDIPANVTMEDPTVSQGTWESPVWYVGELDIGDTATISSAAELSRGSSSTITATAHGALVDPNTNNNRFEIEVTNNPNTSDLWIEMGSGHAIGDRVSFSSYGDVTYHKSDGSEISLEGSANETTNTVHVYGRYIAYTIYDNDTLGVIVYGIKDGTPVEYTRFDISNSNYSASSRVDGLRFTPSASKLTISHSDNGEKLSVFDMTTKRIVNSFPVSGSGHTSCDDNHVYTVALYPRATDSYEVDEIVKLNLSDGSKQLVRDFYGDDQRPVQYFIKGTPESVWFTSGSDLVKQDMGEGYTTSTEFEVGDVYAMSTFDLFVIQPGSTELNTLDFYEMSTNTSDEVVSDGYNYHPAVTRFGEFVVFGNEYTNGSPEFVFSQGIVTYDNWYSAYVPVVMGVGSLGEHNDQIMNIFIPLDETKTTDAPSPPNVPLPPPPPNVPLPPLEVPL